MKGRLSFCLIGLLLCTSVGCSTATDDQNDAKESIEHSGIYAPEEIFRPDGTLEYRVHRLTSMSALGTRREIHEIDFFSENGERLVKKQNYLLGAPEPVVCLAWYYDDQGRLKETRHYSVTDRTLSKVEHHDADGKVISVDEYQPEDAIFEMIPLKLWRSFESND